MSTSTTDTLTDYQRNANYYVFPDYATAQRFEAELPETAWFSVGGDVPEDATIHGYQQGRGHWVL